ncbi:MAG TPA: PfkB family carbohydrate kinase [Solirubrobacteraceae bacterium]|nr:PfkB family carbohydrate kinase [Solirubrobacteraceae bacterium]
MRPDVRVAVVGHVEWVQFARVAHVPAAGEVVHASDAFEEPAGGGAVAAVQLARLAGTSLLITALGDDEHGHKSIARLGELGVRVLPVWRDAPTRRAVTLLDPSGERTITTFGERLEPRGDDRVAWRELERMDAVYFTAGDLRALQRARRARTLVASPRALHALGHGVALDALTLSTHDAAEQRAAGEQVKADAELLVLTNGAEGGRYVTHDGISGSWRPATPPGPAVDSYGCGDSFAAGLTFGLGAGEDVEEALTLAAKCGAYCLTGRGPYASQLAYVPLD